MDRDRVMLISLRIWILMAHTRFPIDVFVLFAFTVVYIAAKLMRMMAKLYRWF